jgi:hypothetical protein
VSINPELIEAIAAELVVDASLVEKDWYAVRIIAAIAGKANILITANFKDFISKDTEIVIPDRHAVYRSPDDHAFQIVHPYLMMDWMRSGQVPRSARCQIFNLP